MNLEEFKNQNRNDVFYGRPLFSFQAHETNIKMRQKRYMQVENGSPT